MTEGHPLVNSLPGWLIDRPLDEVMEEVYKAITLMYLAGGFMEGKVSEFTVRLVDQPPLR
jgi:hypothetical protein